jgi:protocatechuate 3,4-dioxygenase beta subunit
MRYRLCLGLTALLCVASSGGTQESGDHPFGGQVLDESGKPVAGATIRVLSLKTVGDGIEYEVDQTTKTDAQGRFHSTVPKCWLRMSQNYRQELGIVALHEGRMAGLSLSRNSLPAKGGLELRIPAPAETTVTVRSPDGRPVAGAVVTTIALQVEQVNADLTDKELSLYRDKVKQSPNGYVVSRGAVPLPAELYAIAGKTDDAGRVKVPRLGAGQIGGIQVQSAEFGTQQVVPYIWAGTRGTPPDWAATIKLEPVGRLRGQLTGPPQAVANREVLIGTVANKGEVFHGGRETVRTDAEGKFEIARLAIGTVRMRLAGNAKAPDFVTGMPKAAQLKAGATLDLKLAVKPAARLTGVVLNAETKKPVADAQVIAGNDQEATAAMTDAGGRYTLWIAPGKVMVVPQVPEGFLQPVSPDDFGNAQRHMAALPKEIDVAGETMELPPVLLHPEVTLRGVVVDEGGHPIAGASVSAIARLFDHRRGAPDIREVAVRTDERGEFTVSGLDPRVSVRLRAQHGSASKVVSVAKPGNEPIRIAIGTREAFRIAGRVVDANGQAVANANLELWHRDWRPPPGEGEPKKVALKEAIRTDQSGKFATPPILSDGQYRFTIRAAGIKTTETGWLDATAADTAKPQQLVVTRLGGLAGVLRDRQGKPIADAQVTLLSRELRIATATNAQGEFKLEIPGGKAFCVIARHPDFRVHGVSYDKDPPSLDQVLTRLSEPAEKRMPRPIMAKDERQKLLQQLLTPYKEKLAKEKSADEIYRAAQVLGQADPEHFLAFLEKNPLKAAMENDSLLLLVVKRWAGVRSDDAEELIGKMQTPYIKALSLCELADGLPDNERARKRDVLAEALVAARAEKSPEFRAIVLGFVGRRLFDLGDKERATGVLREGAKVAGGLATGTFAGYARGSFATDLAVIDLPAALAMVKDLKDAGEFRRHHGNIAHRIARLDPQAAVKVLDLIPGPKANEFNERDHYAIRVCYRMASVDLPRSLKVTESIVDVFSRAQALGVIAQAVSRKDPRTAVDLLRRAYGLLEEEAQRPDPPELTSPLTEGSVAAVLVFCAAAIDSTLVDECIWRAAALQRSPTDDPQKVWRYHTTNNALAMVIALYDARLAELLLPGPGSEYPSREAPLAQFLVHPERAVQPAGKKSTPQEARQRLAQVIRYAGTEEGQLPRLIHHTLGIWRIDAEDIDY